MISSFVTLTATLLIVFFKDFVLIKNKMFIGSREVSSNTAPLIIAEIGINHGGSLETAKSMVKLAKYSGAECVKHQTHFVDDEMTDEAD